MWRVFIVSSLLPGYGSWGSNQVVRSGSSGLCPLSHLASPLFLLFNFVYMCTWYVRSYAHMCTHPQELEEGFAYPAARIIGSCELPDMAGGDGIPVLY